MENDSNIVDKVNGIEKKKLIYFTTSISCWMKLLMKSIVILFSMYFVVNVLVQKMKIPASVLRKNK